LRFVSQLLFFSLIGILNLMRVAYFLFFFCLFIACNGNNKSKEGDKTLAKAYNQTLMLSDTEGLFPEGTTKEDSTLMLNAFTQRWLHDQLLMYEAERNIPKDLNIDELVRDYRASLVRYNFEEHIIAEKLDSTVSDAELKDFYQTNKDQFQLENTILKCLLIKVPVNAPQNELNKLWYAKDRSKLMDYAKNWAVVSLLDYNKWYRLEEVAAFLPKGTLSADNISARKEGSLSDDGFRFYYRVLETVRGKETAPFEFVREQASKVILHRRKQELLDKWKEDLYQKELRRTNIKIF
jgi:hypothetical protein